MDVVAQMKKLLEPKSVAVIGVSRAPMIIRGATFDVLTNLINSGYQGKIYPINPQASEIQGLKTYANIADAPADIDLAVINLPRDSVPGIVRECIGKGIKAITIVTQGFAEADDEGKRLQREIEHIIRGTDTRILGPNSLGTANGHINFNSSFVAAQIDKIPVGFMCQTGIFLIGLTGLKLVGKGMDLGNGCDVHFVDGLEYFEQDPETKVVGLHIEGMKHASRFLKVASRVTCKKPIVALKTGISQQAAQAAQSHTGSLIGRSEVWSAALKQAGMTKVNDIEELSDTVSAFYTLPPMRGRRVGIITVTGGFGIIGIDACHKHGLYTAKPVPGTINRLSALYPHWQNPDNPADIWPAIQIAKKASPFKVLEKATIALLDDPGVDAVLCILYAISPAFTIDLHQLVQKAARSHTDKPLVFFLYGPFATEVKDKLEANSKTMAFPSPDRAMRALGHLADYSEFLAKS